jgi:hypothetical protein
MPGCRKDDRRYPPTEDQQCEADQDIGTEVLVAGPRVSLDLFIIFLGCALFDFGGGFPSENGGRVGIGFLSLNHVLLAAFYLNCAHGDEVRGEMGKKGSELGGSRGSQMVRSVCRMGRRLLDRPDAQPHFVQRDGLYILLA